MKTHYKKIITVAPAVVLTATLASCGGGGGGGGSSITYQSAVTSLPSETYTLGSNEQQIWDRLNDVNGDGSGASSIRTAGGYLMQNPALDQAASNHVTYLISNSLLNAGIYPGYLTAPCNGTVGGHCETSTLPGSNPPVNTVNFNGGTTPQIRADLAGYNGTVFEAMTFGATDGANCVDLLGDSVYHAISLISPFVDLGISFNPGGGGNVSACAIEIGVPSGTLGQLPANAPVVYPYDGQSGVLPQFDNHAEVPVPADDVPTAGHPVLVSLYTLTANSLNASALTINTFSITPTTGPNTGITLTNVRVLVSSGGVINATGVSNFHVDSNIPGPGFVVLLPEGPLDPSTTYAVSFSATVTGYPAVAKNWSFTTGP